MSRMGDLVLDVQDLMVQGVSKEEIAIALQVSLELVENVTLDEPDYTGEYEQS